MFYASIPVIPCQTTHLAERLTRPLSRQSLVRTARVIGRLLLRSHSRVSPTLHTPRERRTFLERKR